MRACNFFCTCAIFLCPIIYVHRFCVHYNKIPCFSNPVPSRLLSPRVPKYIDCSLPSYFCISYSKTIYVESYTMCISYIFNFQFLLYMFYWRFITCLSWIIFDIWIHQCEWIYFRVTEPIRLEFWLGEDKLPEKGKTEEYRCS